ncbi:MAG: hypothetical protein U0168_07470 [Nannocystaceae bacterium]
MTRALALLLLFTACARAESDHGGGAPPAQAATTATPGTEPPASRSAAEQAHTAADRARRPRDGGQGPGRRRRPVRRRRLRRVGAQLSRVVAVGSFAHDRGCETVRLLVDRRWHAGDAGVAARARDRGLRRRRAGEREALARRWVDEVEHAFGDHFVSASELAFELDGSSRFQPVLARTNKLGAVVVEELDPGAAGMQDESAFQRMRYTISPQGELQREARFSVEGPRLRGCRQSARPRSWWST